MKKPYIFLLFIFLSFNIQAITADVDRVTVYTSGAYVERILRITDMNINRITVEALPPELDDSTLIVEGEGIKILGVNIVKKQMLEVFNQKLKELNDKLKELEENEKRVKNEIDVTQARIEYFTNLSKTLSSNLPEEFFKKRFDRKESEDIIAFISTGLAQTLTQKASLESKLEGIKKEIDRIKREISDIQTPGKKFRKDVEILVSPEKSSEKRLRVSYFRPGATWQPVYRIDADPENDHVLLTMKAEVTQSGGEDWKNAELLFSTAEPTIYGTPPKPSPWFIDFMPEYPPLRPLTKEQLAPMVVAPAQEMTEKAEIAAEVPPPPVEERGIAYIFRTERRVDVPSDNMPHEFDIISKKLDAEFSYKVFPDYSQFAYLVGKATLPDDFPLIRGKLVLFQKGAYVGEAEAEFASAGDELILPAGLDKNLSIEKKLIRRKEFSEGVFSKEKRVNQAYQVIFKNPYKKSIPVEVLARIPVSRQEELKVKIVKITPEAEINDREGFLTWKILAGKNEKYELYYEFDVTYPVGKRVGGL